MFDRTPVGDGERVVSDYVLDGSPDVDDPDALVGQREETVGLGFGEVFVDTLECRILSLIDMYAELR